MIDLFDFMKLIFSKDDKKWNEVNNVEKNRNFFMMNRFLSIQFPVQVHALSLLKINAASCADYWRSILNMRYSSTPRWIYAKTKKRSKQTKNKNLILSEKFITWYCQKNEISKRDFNQELEFFPDKIKELKKLEKILIAQKAI